MCVCVCVCECLISYLLMFCNSYFVGEFNACSVGTNFMPHIITVNAGEVRLISERKEISVVY